MKKSVLIVLLTCAVLYAAGDGSAVLTSWVDFRHHEYEISTKPTWEFVITGTWDEDDTGSPLTTIPINGIILTVTLTVPANKNNSLGEIEIGDNAQNIIFDSYDQAAGSSYTFSLFEPVFGNMNVWIGPSGAFGAGGGEIVATIRGI